MTGLSRAFHAPHQKQSMVAVLKVSRPEAADVSVVIPALNQRANLESLLELLRIEIAELGLVAEVIVVDGGSDDGTCEAAVAAGAHVVRQAERGYGGAILTGFSAAAARYVVTMDADLSHPPTFLRAFWVRRHEADVVIGSRYIRNGRADTSWMRRVLSKLWNRTYRRALSLPIHDLSSGFRMYDRRVLDRLQLVARDFDVLEEILVRIHVDGWRIQEVPFEYRPRGNGKSRATFVKFSWASVKTLRRMWQLRNSVAAADYDYRAFDSAIWLQRYWQRTRHRIVLGYLEQRESVLDVGCGSSRIILDLPRAVGLDILENKLRWLRPKHRLLVRGSCTRIPFPDESFGAVINSEVIEHIPDSPETLSEAWRVLKPGGVLVLGTPDYGRWLWWVLEWIYGKVLSGGYADEHITHFTRETLAARLQASGFEIIDYQYVGFCELIFKARKVA
jgi:dolichol-phosphate mannosyltransferase